MTTHIFLPAVSEIAAIFEEECTALGATSVDCAPGETGFFGRAVCGQTELICPGDEVHGGVAVRVDGPDVFFHPYSVRKVCVNGAIMPMVHGTTRIERIVTEEIVSTAAFTAGVLSEMRQAVRNCADFGRLSKTGEQMRSLVDREAAAALPLLMFMIHSRGLSPRIIATILERHASTDDSSAFGVFSAVTSVARDTQDAKLRWDLECVGGELVAQAGSLVAPSRRTGVLVGA